MVKPEHCPVTTILISSLTNAIDMKHRLAGFTRIAYEIYTLEETLKYGESADEPNGERIYRQIWHFPGWPTQPADWTAGSDIISVVNARPHITKNDLAVRVWDLRDIPYQNIYQPHKETLDVEGELIKRHIEQFKRAPIGNKVEQRRLDKGLQPVKQNTAVLGFILDDLFYK